MKLKKVSCFKLEDKDCKGFKIDLKMKHSDKVTDIFSKEIASANDISTINPYSIGLDTTASVSFFDFLNKI